MRIGLIARADKTGLGVQTYEFYKHMNPDKVMVVDLHHCSGQRPDMSMYPGASIWHDGHYPDVGIRKDKVVDNFLKDLDLVFTCETPYSYYLIQRARELGVKTVQQYNFEFLDYLYFKQLPLPDLLAAPSPWRMDYVKSALPGQRVEFLPVPVNRERLPFRKRERLEVLLHTAGTPAIEDRNGTNIAIEAMKHVKSPVRLEIKSQKPLARTAKNTSVDRRHYPHYHELYGDQDAYIMPRKFGGLCLPINEAMSVGMPVIASATEPQTSWLPEELLVEGEVTHQIFTKCDIDIFEVNVLALAEKIDYLYENPEVFAGLSERVDEIISEYDWTVMKPKYLELFESLLEGG